MEGGAWFLTGSRRKVMTQMKSSHTSSLILPSSQSVSSCTTFVTLVWTLPEPFKDTTIHCFDDVTSPLPNLNLSPNLPLHVQTNSFLFTCHITAAKPRVSLSFYLCGVRVCVCVCVPCLLSRPLLAYGLWPLLITGRGPGIPESSLLKIHSNMETCTHVLSCESVT